MGMQLALTKGPPENRRPELVSKIGTHRAPPSQSAMGAHTTNGITLGGGPAQHNPAKATMLRTMVPLRRIGDIEPIGMSARLVNIASPACCVSHCIACLECERGRPWGNLGRCILLSADAAPPTLDERSLSRPRAVAR